MELSTAMTTVNLKLPPKWENRENQRVEASRRTSGKELSTAMTTVNLKLPKWKNR
jgi:hypothetical protein